MSDFGFRWMEFGRIERNENEYEYMDVFYNHNIPVNFKEELEFTVILTPEKYLSISAEILNSYRNGKLDAPLNTFEPRKFVRNKKLINRNKGYKKKKNSKFILFFVLILIVMLTMFKLLSWLKLIN